MSFNVNIIVCEKKPCVIGILFSVIHLIALSEHMFLINFERQFECFISPLF